MKTKEQIEKKVKKLKNKLFEIWNGSDSFNKNDICDELQLEIETLKWVLKK